MSIRVKIESNIYKYMCNLFHFLRILIFEKKRKKLYRYTLSRRNFYFSILIEQIHYRDVRNLGRVEINCGLIFFKEINCNRSIKYRME